MRTLGHEILEEALPPLVEMVTTFNNMVTVVVDAVEWFEAYNVVLNESSLRWQHFANQQGAIGYLLGAAISTLDEDFRGLVNSQIDVTRESEEMARQQRDTERAVGDTTLTIKAQTDQMRDLAKSYQDAREDLEQNFYWSLARANENFSRQQAAAEREYNRQRLREIGNYHERVEDEREKSQQATS